MKLAQAQAQRHGQPATSSTTTLIRVFPNGCARRATTPGLQPRTSAPAIALGGGAFPAGGGSPHRANMLRSGATQSGIAAAYAPQSKYKVVLALILAAPDGQPG